MPEKLNKGDKYVVMCIKGNNNKCGYGYRYKVGQFLTYYGRPTNDVTKAYVYEHDSDYEDDLNWSQYFKRVPVEIKIKD